MIETEKITKSKCLHVHMEVAPAMQVLPIPWPSKYPAVWLAVAEVEPREFTRSSVHLNQRKTDQSTRIHWVFVTYFGSVQHCECADY
jgi:hypothetical protein